MSSIKWCPHALLKRSYGVWFSIVSPSQVMFVVQLPITGIAMLFSAGTFLYVATVHVLTELTHTHVHSSSESNSTPSNSKLSKCELLLVVLGTFLPLGFSLVHHHWQCDFYQWYWNVYSGMGPWIVHGEQWAPLLGFLVENDGTVSGIYRRVWRESSYVVSAEALMVLVVHFLAPGCMKFYTVAVGALICTKFSTTLGQQHETVTKSAD